MIGGREKPAYIRQQEKTEAERDKAQIHQDSIDNTAALNAVANEIKTAGDKQDSKEAQNNLREWVGVGGIYLAAGVAIWAICSASHDARHQLSAVIESNCINRNSYTAVQRAFVSADELKQQMIIGNNGVKILKFTPIVVNSGTTPATNVTIAAATPVNDWMLRPERESAPKYQFLAWKTHAPMDPDDISLIPAEIGMFAIKNLTIGPKGVLSDETLSAELDWSDFNTQLGKSLGRFFYGSIHYEDVFHAFHVTKYCFYIDRFSFGSEGVQILPGKCPHWNCTDEYCAQDKENYEDDVKAALVKGVPNDWPPVPKGYYDNLRDILPKRVGVFANYPTAISPAKPCAAAE